MLEGYLSEDEDTHDATIRRKTDTGDGQAVQFLCSHHGCSKKYRHQVSLHRHMRQKHAAKDCGRQTNHAMPTMSKDVTPPKTKVTKKTDVHALCQTNACQLAWESTTLQPSTTTALEEKVAPQCTTAFQVTTEDNCQKKRKREDNILVQRCGWGKHNSKHEVCHDAQHKTLTPHNDPYSKTTKTIVDVRVSPRRYAAKSVSNTNKKRIIIDVRVSPRR